MECFTIETANLLLNAVFMRSIRRLQEPATPYTLSPEDLSEPVMKGLSQCFLTGVQRYPGVPRTLPKGTAICRIKKLINHIT
jgi:hypothetical protein